MRPARDIAVVFLWVLAAPLLLGGGLPSNSFSPRRQFELSYAADFTGLPKNAGTVRIWIPLASTREGQTVLQRDISAPVSYQVNVDPVYGNEMAYLEVQSPIPDPLQVRIDYRVEVTKARWLESSRKIEDPRRYLKPSRLMVVNEEVEKRALQATGSGKTWFEKARAIYDDVIARMVYDKTAPGWGRGDTLRACRVGKGNCTDFHSLFISMAHAAEIPARFKIGFTIPEESQGAIAGYHCWAEFYEEGKGWRPVDASEAWKHPERKEAYFGAFDTNKFLISVGRDVDLVPRQSRFSANIFFYPYVEVGNEEWSGVKTSFQFKNLET